jgi:leader peptidase (prepilin peptidase)/N-methyltransferase
MVVLVAAQSLAAALVAAQVGWRPALAGSLVAVFSGIWLAAVDLRTHRLPIYAVYAATASVLLLLVLAALAGQDPQRALAVCAGAGALRLVYQVVSFGIGGIGAGDVRLSGLLGAVGAWTGWHGWVLTMVLPFVAFAMVGAVVNAVRRQRGGPLPFGPAMALGLLAVVVAG